MSTGVVAAPELDMADLGAASSSSSVVANLIDLSLNLGPPPIPPPDPRVRLVLELALGRHDFHESVQVSRQNWPRFEPGMSGLLPAGGPEDESSARTNSRRQGIDRTDASAPPARASSQESRLQPRELEPLVSDRNDEELPFSGLRQRLLRNRRHLRQSRRPRQALVSILDQLEASAGALSNIQDGIVGADDDSRSNRPFAIRTGTLNASLDMPSSKTAFSNSVSKLEDKEKTEVGHVGAHFECNICLEMATDPVVTCCGHLFCWPCLYQWLYVHSVQKECPVCKGFLSGGVITPIYGRGSVQDTGKSLDDIPPRPQALRLNSKRCRQERTAQDRLDGDVRLERSTQERLDGDARGPGGVNMSDLVTERSGLEGSENRPRVAQRLQRELLGERLRVLQRITGRRGGALRSSPMIGGTAQGLNSISPGTQDLEQYHRGQRLAWMHMNRIETTDSLSLIRARMEGLREDLVNMQRSMQISSSLPGLTDTHFSEEGASSGVVHQPEPPSDDVWMPPPRIETPMQRHLTNIDVQPQQGSAESTLVLWRELRRAASGASTSFDIEPGSLHARKRRRLN